MNKLVIGCDPDSKAHGFALYQDGKLIELSCKTLMEIIKFIERDWIPEHSSLCVHIEDVCAMNAVFIQRQKQRGNQKVSMSMARSVGKCQQAQIELERVFEHHGIKVVKHKISKTWKKDKSQFEKVTGWKGRSNEDTRSAAWFGYLGIK